jgi:hypothetical protein
MTKLTSMPQLVQILDGIGSRPIDGEDFDVTLVVAQWEPQLGRPFCEFESEGSCDSGSVSWGTSDPYEPRFCTKHFFDGSTGYELVSLSPDQQRELGAIIEARDW